jgi:hypothetical protein
MKQYLSEYGGILLLAIFPLISNVLVLILMFKEGKKVLKENVIYNIFYGKRFFSNPFIPFVFPCGLIVFSIVDYLISTSYLAIFIIGWLLFVILNRLFGKIMKNKFIAFSPGKNSMNRKILKYLLIVIKKR